eukprot:scaffold15716_cov119-Isochrysis_galbana.AAC.6
MSAPLTSAPQTDAKSPRTARSKNWMIFRKYPTYRLPNAYRWYSVPTKRPEAKRAHASEIFAQFLPKIFAKTKNLPSTFPVGTSGYSSSFAYSRSKLTLLLASLGTGARWKRSPRRTNVSQAAIEALKPDIVKNG